MLAFDGDGDREEDVGEQADRGPAVPRFSADDLSGVQAGALLSELVIFIHRPAAATQSRMPTVRTSAAA